ncbi:hypothetical protein J3R30DRAFT_3697520 [Lentinula aciculospora]|uniref:EamA domain-containing protein n=1 Tax=Lentinula aciculospora TaxID=153920 RepID=A0A9W9ALZ6_9AGAR|nr:hypothetical protein J3R30DRAFT_3697520 [Lentinula aciculospora]
MDRQRSSSHRKPLVALILALGGFVSQTQLTHQVLTAMNYNRPFFVIYVTQSVFTVSVLVHLLYLVITSKDSMYSLCKGLKITIAQRLRSESASPDIRFPYANFFLADLTLTVGFTTPTLLWCVGMSLSSTFPVVLAMLQASYVIWNTNAFFAYLISVTVLGQQYHNNKFAAVVLATVGVMLVVYGGLKSEESVLHVQSPSRLVGDLLALLASVLYAGYQLFYDGFVQFPLVSPQSLDNFPSESTPLLEDYKDAIYPSPYGLESSFWTSMIGLCTISLLWIAFPILQGLGIEEFGFPTDGSTMLAILGAALSGAAFMTGTMMLLASWGATTTAVTSLLTTVLVFLTDLLLGAAVGIWSIFGSFIIVAAFGMLVLADSSPVFMLAPTTQESNT